MPALMPYLRAAGAYAAAHHALRLALACFLAPVSAGAAEAPPAMGGNCVLAEFRSGALLAHAPDDRKAFAVAWLKKNADQCSIAQLRVLVANRPIWLGTADTPDVAQLIDAVLERRTSGNLEQFTSPVPPTPRPGSTGGTAAPGAVTATPPRPVLAEPPATSANPAAAKK